MPGMINGTPLGRLVSSGRETYQVSDPSRDRYRAWQEASAELERLRGIKDPFGAWKPETRRGGGSGVEYLVGDRWATQEMWDDPRFQEMVVNPAMEQARQAAMEKHSKSIADAMQRAEMAKYDYEDYLQRQEEIKAGRPAMRSTTTPNTGGMMRSGRGGY